MIRSDLEDQFASVREAMSNGWIIHVFGDVDIMTASRLDTAISEAIAELSNGDDELALNFTRCRYLDSSGLAVLVRARRAVGHRLTIVVRATSMIARLMNVTKFDQVFNIVIER